MTRAELFARRAQLTRSYQDSGVDFAAVRAKIASIDDELRETAPPKKPPLARRWKKRASRYVREID